MADLFPPPTPLCSPREQQVNATQVHAPRQTLASLRIKGPGLSVGGATSHVECNVRAHTASSNGCNGCNGCNGWPCHGPTLRVGHLRGPLTPPQPAAFADGRDPSRGCAPTLLCVPTSQKVSTEEPLNDVEEKRVS